MPPEAPTASPTELDLIVPPPPRALLSWSTGKDSAFALYQAARTGQARIVALLTTMTTSFGRVSMHGVRESLLDLQAEALGLPLWKVPIPTPCSNAAYESAMAQALGRARAEGIAHVVFGDLFLEEIRAYRESRLAQVNMAALFPIWRSDTTSLAREMVASGLRATVTCVDPRKLDPSWAGRTYDEAFLSELPSGVDPCGENGEFHTFAWAGPMFREPVLVEVGEIVERDGFVFADLLRR